MCVCGGGGGAVRGSEFIYGPNIGRGFYLGSQQHNVAL